MIGVLNHRLNLSAGSQAFATNNALNARNELRAHIVGVVANVQHNLGLARDCVIRIAGLQRADGQNTKLVGRNLAPYNSLQAQNDCGSQVCRVNGVVRHRPMCGATCQRDANSVTTSKCRAGHGHYLTCGAGNNVLAEAHIWGGDEVCQAVVNHGLCTAGQFLGGLEQGNESTRPLRLSCCHQASQTKTGRHVHVMATGVHDGGGRTIAGGTGSRGSEVHTCFLENGKRIDISAEQHGRAGAIFHDTKEAVTTDSLMHCVSAHVAKSTGQIRGSFLLRLR